MVITTKVQKMAKMAVACLSLLLGMSFVLSALSDHVSTAQAMANSWGLGFHTEGQPPTGNATSEYLAQYNALFIGDVNEKTIYLTFDAGYENGHTPAILETLAKHNVPAAFFLVGHYLEANADLVRQMVAEGHIVGNHTFGHPDMSQITDAAAFERELTKLADLFEQITGQQMPKLYRPPQGKFSQLNLEMARDLGYRTIFWSLAYADWRDDAQPTHEEAFAKLLPRMHPGAIILLHSTSRTNAEILDEFITKMLAEGYVFGRLDELP